MPGPRSSSSRSSSGESRRTTRSNGTTITSRTTDVSLPKKSRRMDFLLWTAGARPRDVLCLRRSEITEESEYGTAIFQKHGKGRGDEVYRRQYTQWSFVSTPAERTWWDWHNAEEDDDDDDSSSASFSTTHKSKRSSRSSSSRHRTRGRRGGRSKKASSQASDSSDEDSDDSDDSEAYSNYGPPMGPPPPFHHNGPPPPPPQFRGPMPAMPAMPPQRQDDGGGEMPAFFTL